MQDFNADPAIVESFIARHGGDVRMHRRMREYANDDANSCKRFMHATHHTYAGLLLTLTLRIEEHCFYDDASDMDMHAVY